jgi:exodeoxyribonuclease VII large subunit
METELLQFSPSEFVDICNQTLEFSYGVIEVQGEVSNFRVSKNTWVYFDIKDESATIKCFGTVHMLPGPLDDGMLVRVVCSPRLHPLYNFSLTVHSVRAVGEGAIAKASELLFKKLEAEGLFLPERKRPIPYPPEHIALVASVESAGYADFMKVIKHRWPHIQIESFNVLVQGASAPKQIVEVCDSLNARGDDFDVLVLVRGGGSSEDLAVFSDERVVRAVARSRIPTMVAIGHEVDESLAELASDARASTPSNAAELLVPDRVSELSVLSSERSTLDGMFATSISTSLHTLSQLRHALHGTMTALISDEQTHMVRIKSRLELLNPQTVLSRGYTIIKKDGVLVKHGSELMNGDVIDIIFEDASRKATIHG